MDKLEKLRLKGLLVFESEFRGKGYKSIAGVDEAGRGPLAGPVAAAACIVPEGMLLEGIDDSKKLTPKRRESLFSFITSNQDISYAISFIDPEVIDAINIYQATVQAMHEALDKISPKPDFLLVDGIFLSRYPIPSQKIIKGDSKSQSIAAASILAKVARDNLMMKYHKKWPEYGFDSHKGYGTKKHMDAIKKYGFCSIHRKSFEPIKSFFF